MIKSFLHEGKELRFISSSSISLGGQAIFSADSMTLLVGPNGAGKTACLLSLVRHATEDEFADEQALIFDEKTDREKTCVIYYTPVPFLTNAPKSEERRTVIVPTSSTKKESVTDIQTAIASALKQDFGIDAASTLKLNTITDRDIERLVHIILDSERVEQEWVQKYSAAYEDIKRRQNSFRGAFAIKDSPERNQLNKDVDELHKNFLIEYALFAGSEYAMKIRAFQTAQRAYKTTSGANLQLLEELGFDIAERYYNLLPKKSTKARVVFRKTLSLLRTVSEIIDDKTLENDVHSITEIQVSQLSKLHLGSIGYTRFKQLSSGAAALIDQFSGITLAVHQLSGKDRFKNLLLLIDEGDAFLHLSWQKRYVDYLDRMIENFKSTLIRYRSLYRLTPRFSCQTSLANSL